MPWQHKVDIMKKIVVLSGSPRKKGHTMSMVDQLLDSDQFEVEYIHLYDYDLKGCIGCKVCLKKDGRACPFKDDVQMILEKLESAHGLIFASPTYSRAVTGPFKTFIDRTNYVLHRPLLYGKPVVTLATTDLGMAKRVAAYLGVIASSMGARVVGSLPVKMGSYNNKPAYHDKVTRDIQKLGKAFQMAVLEDKNHVPSLKELMRFNVWKIRAEITKDQFPGDRQYWADHGWLDQKYFYPVHLPIYKRIFVRLLNARLPKVIKNGFVYEK